MPVSPVRRHGNTAATREVGCRTVRMTDDRKHGGANANGRKPFGPRRTTPHAGHRTNFEDRQVPDPDSNHSSVDLASASSSAHELGHPVTHDKEPPPSRTPSPAERARRERGKFREIDRPMCGKSAAGLIDVIFGF